MKKLTFLVSTLIATFLLSGCLTPELPKCDDKETKSLLGKTINKLFKEADAGATFISSNNILEEGFNKESKIRVCSADIMASDASKGTVTYNIRWTNEKKGLYELSIVDFVDTE